MSVKNQLSLIKQLLYVREIISCKTIASAAIKNGIKAPNLSKIIKETEKQLGQILFIRTTKGLIPTSTAREISKIADALFEMSNIYQTKYLRLTEPQNLRFFISKGLVVQGLDKICQDFVLSSAQKNADVIISTRHPKNADKMLSVQVKIGDVVTQDIWICAKDIPFAEQIVTSLVLLFQN